MDELRETLHLYFDFDDFRGKQREVIERIMAGESGLAIFPTGEGKSLCYQLPAMLLDGLTIVLSPVIALTPDQVDTLTEKGIPATFINASIERRQSDERLQQAIAGKLKLLYITPERFRVAGFLAGIAKCRISLIAVDEAHCMSQWGHDFRPDYSQVGAFRHSLGDPTVLALTATATPNVQREILRKLRMPHAWVIHTGIKREHLALSVTRVDTDDEKTERIVARATALGGPGIVYFALIRDLLELETELRRRGIRPLIYHGDLTPEERKTMLTRFMAMEKPLMLATSAFATGVDRPDIRFIIHHEIPRTLEAYYQDVGRAGRDGKDSLCELLFREEDVLIQKELTVWANPRSAFVQSVIEVLQRNRHRWSVLEMQDLRETLAIKDRRDGRIETVLGLLEAAGCCRGQLGRGTFELIRSPDEEEIRSWISPDQRERDLGNLLPMIDYAESLSCRKVVLHRHLGFGDLPEGCGVCDRCVDETPALDPDPPRADERPHEASEPVDTGPPAPGDRIDIERFGRGTVIEVEGRGHDSQIEVELGSTKRRRRFYLDRIRWKKL